MSAPVTREDKLADLVSRHYPVMEAGRAIGLTKGQTSRAWQNIKAALGEQAR